MARVDVGEPYGYVHLPAADLCRITADNWRVQNQKARLLRRRSRAHGREFEPGDWVPPTKRVDGCTCECCWYRIKITEVCADAYIFLLEQSDRWERARYLRKRPDPRDANAPKE